MGNGSTEIFFALARALPLDRALIPVPSYSDYATAFRMAGREVRFLKLEESRQFALDWHALEAELRGGEIVLLGQPNNPTGMAFDTGLLRAVAARHASTMFVVDEAFADFIRDYRSLAEGESGNLIVVRSLDQVLCHPRPAIGLCRGESHRGVQHPGPDSTLVGEPPGTGGGRGPLVGRSLRAAQHYFG